MKTTLLLSIAIILALFANAQDVNIPDANFKAALLAHDPVINTNMDGEIQVSEAEAFTGSIIVANQTHSDLSGYEAFIAIDGLYCENNQLTILDVSNNTALRYLVCFSNQLTTLDVSNKYHIRYFDCRDNQLTSLKIKNITVLESITLVAFETFNNPNLFCIEVDDPVWSTANWTGLDAWTSFNDICTTEPIVYIPDANFKAALVNNSSININMDGEIQVAEANSYAGMINVNSENISDLTGIEAFLNITSLECDYNQLTTLDVSNSTYLDVLFCSNNQLTSLDVSNNTFLTILVCHNNQLTSLDVSYNVYLYALALEGNQLTSIDLSDNTVLATLNLFNNQLTSLDVSNNTALNTIGCSNNQLTSLDVSNNLVLDILHCEANQLTSLDVSNNTLLNELWCGYSSQLSNLNIKNTSINQLYTLESPNLSCIEVDNVELTIINLVNGVDSWTSFGSSCLYGIADPNIISGKVLIDDNCEIDGAEQGVEGIIVKTEPENYYGITNSLGEYTISTDTGTYNVEQVFPNRNGLLINSLCPEAGYHTVNFGTLAQDTTGIDFFNEIIECPYLTVDLNSNRRRRCFQNHTYVSYCNEGLINASGVEVHIQFPEYVNLLTADYLYTVDGDGNYVFDIGDLAQGECGSIHIVDSVSCEDGIMGLTQCTKAWITPVNDCVFSQDTLVTSQWDKSSVMVEGECVDNSIVNFTITNTGDYGEGDMQSTSEYRIYADNELVYTGTFQLNGGEELVIEVPANGQTIRLEADQHPAHPGNSHPRETIEACGDGGEPISLGFVNAASMDDADMDIEIDCMEIIDSYDPNDKSVSPQGITDNNYLMPGTTLEYLIRFQNTGSDTAYNIVVVDTLSEYLDISTIQWGINSHQYTIDVSGQGQPILEFTFNDINLPDSTTNEANSHGFVKFKIAPYDTLVNGTEIQNTADIYFDYNLPIRTNIAQIIISDTVITGTPINVCTLNSGFDIITSCNSYNWIDGNIYTANNNTATHTLTNVAGCDSVVALDLTINYPTMSTNIVTSCDSYTWIDGNIYTANNNTAIHTLTNVAGCDSVVTLDLTINDPSTDTDVISACNSYTWIDGVIYTENNNIATHTLINSVGCDSVITLDLTFNNNTGVDIQTACDSYTWIDGVTYTENNNTAIHTLTNVAGCDSVVALDLTIEEVNASIFASDNTLMSSTIGDNYQWLECNESFNLIEGENNQSFTPSQNGSYAVIITENNCVDTSLCYSFIIQNLKSKLNGFDINIYPNPTTGKVTVAAEDIQTIEVIDLEGRKIISTNENKQIDLSKHPKGIYFIKVTTEKGVGVEKIILE